MEEYQSFLRSWRACTVEAASIFLTTCVLMVISVNYQHHLDTFYCQGQLGAGLPVSFLCDYSGGGSPLSSAGRIDLADFPYFSPQGLFVDILFYSVLLWIAWLIRYAVYHKGLHRSENYRWAAFIGIVYIVCFLSAFLLFQSNRLHIEVSATPTPTMLSPTPIGTRPSVITPIATPVT
jgi:hypothetical protein